MNWLFGSSRGCCCFERLCLIELAVIEEVGVLW